MKKLGVIGGMGPAATAYFYERLTCLADARADCEHPETLIISRPFIPDRTAFITGRDSRDPAPSIIEAGRELIQMGAEIIAVPCVTAHCFYDKIADALTVPVINMVDAAALKLKAMGVERAGLLATDGSIRHGVLRRAFDALGMVALAPSRRDIQVSVNDMIYRIKAGEPPDMGVFEAAAKNLEQNGAQAVLLACTELSLVRRVQPLTPFFVDALEELAVQSLTQCGVKLRESP